MEKIKGESIKSVIVKGLVSTLFVSVGIYNVLANQISDMPLRFLILIGLIFGLSGDIFLGLKHVYKDKDELFTYLGFITFAIGHMLYIAAMTSAMPGTFSPLYIIIPILVACFLGFLVIILEKPLKLDYKNMKIALFAYALCLFSLPTVALSFAIFYQFNNRFLVLIAIGGVLFAISDLILSQTYFGEGHDKPIDIIMNHLTYWAAQFLIAMALFF